MKEKAEVKVGELLGSLVLGEKQEAGGLTVFALSSGISSDYNYILLDEALKKGVLKVKEIGEGSVPEISVINSGSEDVFIMDGEELTGAKQNRTVNISMLIPAEGAVNVPVSCVEQGRWDLVSEHFAASENISFADLRRKQKESVMESMANEQNFCGDQSETWDAIEEKTRARRVESPTAAMHDIYEQGKDFMEEHTNVFKPLKGQKGAVFALGDKIFGLDIFDKEETWEKLMPKIIRSYLLENGPATWKKPSVKVEEAEKFLAGLAGAEFSSYKSPGLGTAVSIKGKTASGTALFAKDTAVHTSLFRKKDRGEKMPRPEL